MDHEQKIAMVKELHVGLRSKEEEILSILPLLERGVGAREVALARTSIQEAKHWAEEAWAELEKGAGK